MLQLESTHIIPHPEKIRPLLCSPTQSSRTAEKYQVFTKRFCPLRLYRQLNLLSTATPAIGAWLVPIDQLKSSLRKLDMEGTLRVCAVMGCIMTEALEVSTSWLLVASLAGGTARVSSAPLLELELLANVRLVSVSAEEEHPHAHTEQVQQGDQEGSLPV